MGDLFQVTIYVIIGIIWLISVVTTRNRKKEGPGPPGEAERQGPTGTGEKGLKDFLKTIGLETEPEPSPEPEVVLEQTEQIEDE